MSSARSIRDQIVAHIDEAGFGAHGLHVRVGDEVAEHRWTPDVREEIHSAAKGICVLAAGIAADEGLVSLDEPVGAYLPEVGLGAGVEEVTLRHLLSMSSGVDMAWSATEMTDWPDVAVEFLGRPSRGRVFQYANASTYAAMTVLAARVGDVHAYVEPRLFAPLGIAGTDWLRCRNGRVLAGEGLSLTTEELARLGLLLRDRGVWNGRRIVSEQTVDAMHSDWIVSGENPGYRGYGLGAWQGPGDAWRLHGAHGQVILFVGDAVVTFTAHDHFAADAVIARIVEIVGGSAGAER